MERIGLRRTDQQTNEPPLRGLAGRADLHSDWGRTGLIFWRTAMGREKRRLEGRRKWGEDRGGLGTALSEESESERPRG